MPSPERIPSRLAVKNKCTSGEATVHWTAVEVDRVAEVGMTLLEIEILIPLKADFRTDRASDRQLGGECYFAVTASFPF